MGMMPELRPGAGCWRRWGGPAGQSACAPVLGRGLDPAPPAAVWLNLFGSSGSWKLVTGGAFKT